MKQFSLIILFICTSLSIFGQVETNCTQTVSGELRDGISTDVLVGAEVILYDGSGDIVESQTIKEDGVFSFIITCETAYKIEGIQEDYTSESKTFTTTDEDKRELKLIILLDKGNIDFVSDSEANAKTIDSIPTAEIVMPKDTTDIAADVMVVDEVAPKVSDATDVAVDELEEKEVAAKPLPKAIKKEKERAVPTGMMNVNVTPIYFDYESSWLNMKAKKDLLEVISLMKENPKMVLECAGHTDAKGDIKYNQWMSDRRVKRVIDYMVSKGVSSSRLSGKGYEEKYIINNCLEGVECTDKQRAANRRVEFVIVKM